MLSCSRIKDTDQKVLYTRDGQLLVGDPDADSCTAGELPTDPPLHLPLGCLLAFPPTARGPVQRLHAVTSSCALFQLVDMAPTESRLALQPALRIPGLVSLFSETCEVPCVHLLALFSPLIPEKICILPNRGLDRTKVPIFLGTQGGSRCLACVETEAGPSLQLEVRHSSSSRTEGILHTWPEP